MACQSLAENAGLPGLVLQLFQALRWCLCGRRRGTWQSNIRAAGRAWDRAAKAAIPGGRQPCQGPASSSGAGQHKSDRQRLSSSCNGGGVPGRAAATRSVAKESARLSARRLVSGAALSGSTPCGCSPDSGGDALGKGRKGSAASGVMALSGEPGGIVCQGGESGQGPVTAWIRPACGAGKAVQAPWRCRSGVDGVSRLAS